MKKASLFRIFSLMLVVSFLGACERSTEAPVSDTTAPAATADSEQEDQRLAAFFEEIFERDVSQNPEFQAYLGRKTEDYGRWDDYSDEFAQVQNQQTAADLERLHAEFDYDAAGGYPACFTTGNRSVAPGRIKRRHSTQDGVSKGIARRTKHVERCPV